MIGWFPGCGAPVKRFVVHGKFWPQWRTERAGRCAQSFSVGEMECMRVVLTEG